MVHKITCHEPIEMQWTDPPLTSEVKELLNQPFHFLGKGGQCYVFESEDQQTVIKFFKFHHVRFWNFLEHLPLPHFLTSYREQLLNKHQHQTLSFFESCKIAYESFKKRTGLIYLHLDIHHPISHTLKLIDPIGIVHHIDLDRTPFALQHKAEMPYKKLKTLIKTGRIEEAKGCIDSIVSLMSERYLGGIDDRDSNIRRNLGFLQNFAVEVDLGSFTKGSSPRRLGEELDSKLGKFKKWLEKRNPALALYLIQDRKDPFPVSHREALPGCAIPDPSDAQDPLYYH